MQVRTPIKVRYAETDMMGVVYHANYLLYMEDARTDFLIQAGIPYSDVEDAGYMCPILEADLKYGQPLRYGEDAFVLTKPVKCGAVKIQYWQGVYKEGMDPEVDKPLVEGLITTCIVDRETFTPHALKRTFPEVAARYKEIVEPLEK